MKKLKPNIKRKIFFQLLIAIIITASWFGCDNTIEPLDTEQGNFSVFGGLNIYDDINYIRVKDLNIPTQLDTTGDINASVTLEDLSTGSIETLRDTTVAFDGVVTHNFRTTMDIKPDSRYLLTVLNDQAELTATATTPEISSITIQNELENDVALEDIVTICTEEYLYEMFFDSVNPTEFIKYEVGFEYNDQSYRLKGQSAANNVLEQSAIIRFEIGQVLGTRLAGGCGGLTSTIFTIYYIHYGPEFRGATSDSLAIPGGSGTFGGFYRDSFSFDILKKRPPNN